MKSLLRQTWKVFGMFAVIAAASIVWANYSYAQKKEVTIGIQKIYGPYIAAIANGDFERATGYKINWRQFDAGIDVATAMATGDVQLGPVGSAPLAAVVSRGIDLQMFALCDDIDTAEAFAVRRGIRKPTDLIGKTIGVPFVSTTHYDLMFALKLWSIDPKSIRILNMQPNQIAAAWERGDIDGGFVWGPALERMKKDGRILITAGWVGERGRPTFDGFVVIRKWGEAHPNFMAKFTKALAQANAAYSNNPAAWTLESAPVKGNVKVLGGTAQDVLDQVHGYKYPGLTSLVSSTWLGGGAQSGAAKALKDTSEFLKDEGKIDTVYSNYDKFVTPKYAEAAMKLQ